MSYKEPKKVFRNVKGKPKCRWSPDEDKLLLKSISEFGTHNWKIIATKVPGRSSKQCRERWVGNLSPDVVSSEWSVEEDELLKKLHSELGNQWAKISKHLNGRSMIAVKNRWCCLKRREKNEKDTNESNPVSSDKEKAFIPAEQVEKNDINMTDSIFDFSDDSWKDLDFILNTQHFVFDFNEQF